MNQLATPKRQSRALKPIEEVRQGLSKMEGELATALPSHIPIERFKRVAITAVQQNPSLLKADRKSLFGACMTAAQIGLVTDGVLGQAYLVPFKGKVQLIPGYKGLLTLVRQSGEISSIDVNTIHETDQVEYVMGDDIRLTVRPNWTNRGAIIGAYAIARFKDGGIQRALMTREEIEEIRKVSPSANSPAWKNHYGEMAKKTVFRRLCKMLPLSTEAQAAADLADQADAGRIASVDSEMIIVSEPEPASQEEKPKSRRKARKAEQKPAAEDDARDGQVIEGEAQVIEEAVDDEPEETSTDESTVDMDAGETAGEFF